MSNNYSRDINSSGTEPDESLFNELLNRINQLEKRVDDLETDKQQLKNENQELQERIEELERTHEEQPRISVEDDTDPIGTLTVDDAPVGRAIKSKVSEQDLEQELDDIQDQIDESSTTSTNDTDEDNSRDETPLEQISRLPDEVAQDQLTKNQQRAAKLADRLPELTKSVPAGHSITTKEIADAVATISGSRPHRQTRQRIIEFMNEFGAENTKLVEGNDGRTRLIIDESLHRRLKQLNCPTNQEKIEPVTSVVTTATG